MARSIRHLVRTAAWLLWIAFCTPPLSAESARQAPQVDAVVIHKTEYLCGDEAVLVTKPERVKELADLVLDNETVGHACGFHWLIRFAMHDGTLTTRAHNIECEEYRRNDAEAHALLDRYFQQALKDPQSFIVDLTVRASESPEELSAAFIKVGRIFLFDGAEARLPRLTVETAEKYTAQLVTSKRLDASARRALLAEYPFLLAAAPFDEGCVPVR